MFKLFKKRADTTPPPPPNQSEMEEEIPSSQRGKLTEDLPSDNDVVCVLANYVGVLVLQGATEKRQIRYAMEIVCPVSRRKSECVKRFNQYYDVRQKLLQYMKQSCVCQKCATVERTIRAQPFPSRRIFTTMAHVKSRGIPLEGFLQRIIDTALNWEGCKKTQQGFADIVNQFIGAPVGGYSKADAATTTLDFRSSIRGLMVVRHIESDAPLSDTILQACKKDEEEHKDDSDVVSKPPEETKPASHENSTPSEDVKLVNSEVFIPLEDEKAGKSDVSSSLEEAKPTNTDVINPPEEAESAHDDICSQSEEIQPASEDGAPVTLLAEDIPAEEVEASVEIPAKADDVIVKDERVEFEH
ncbi:hypothetical protein AC1031_016516 [Aphanomyces cochlioides]|nr:hypothetical protein AC1031_016516 [Aphanomyces cochlioides]